MPDPRYYIDELTISGFRAFLVKKIFNFSQKPCLAVFAPNGYGKSSLVDALEFFFSDDGTLERLGLRAVNNQAGLVALAHNLAADTGVEPYITVRFEIGSDSVEATRAAKGPNRPRPVIANKVVECFIVNPLIRGYSLRAFVEAKTAEERYEEVAHWLQLDPFVQVQRSLRLLRQQIRGKASDQTDFARIDSRIARITGNVVNGYNEDAILVFSNNILLQLDKSLSLKKLDQTDTSYITLKRRADEEESQLGLEGFRQIKRAASVLYTRSSLVEDEGSANKGLLVKFAEAVSTRAIAVTKEEAEREKAANSIFAELWKVAEPLFSKEGSAPVICPICTTPINTSTAGSVQGVLEHIEACRAELSQYNTAKKALDEANTNVRSIHSNLKLTLSTLIPLVVGMETSLDDALNVYLHSIESWRGDDLPDGSVLETELIELIRRMDMKIEGIIAEQGENTYIKALRKLDDLLEQIEERSNITRIHEELSKLATTLDDQATFVSAKVRDRMQYLLDTLRNPINAFYHEIQGNDAARVRLELPSEDDVNQQRLFLAVDFAKNRENVQPSGYLSDSQVHSLALSLRLAAIKCFNVSAPVVILDDIVTSYDADHRRTIARLLAKEFADFQIIATTHDERFFNYLKELLPESNWHFTRIVRLEREYGPIFADILINDEMLEAKWKNGESAANEMRQAEEEWLLKICRDFGVNVRIRPLEKTYNYERSELASSLAAFLKDRKLTPPVVPGVGNRFLVSLQQGIIENFGSHFQDSPYGDGSLGDEKARWSEFAYFRSQFVCPRCGRSRFKRPDILNKPVCTHEGCEQPFEFRLPLDASKETFQA